MTREHSYGAPTFLAVLQEYLEANGWHINWDAGSGPDFTEFRKDGLSIKYRWDGSVEATGLPTIRPFGRNNLEDIKFWIEGSKPIVLDEPNSYCDYGQINGKELEDEFGVFCIAPGIKSVQAHSRKVFLCDKHFEIYQKDKFPYFEATIPYSDEGTPEEEEPRETCPDCGEYLDECNCCNSCGSSSCYYCDACDNEGCCCICCGNCNNSPCTCCEDCENDPCICEITPEEEVIEPDSE